MFLRVFVPILLRNFVGKLRCRDNDVSVLHCFCDTFSCEATDNLSKLSIL